MIFLQVNIRSREHDVGASYCVTDFEFPHLKADQGVWLRHIARGLVMDAAKRLTSLEGRQRCALFDKVWVEAWRTEAIGADPEHKISIRFPAAIVTGAKDPVHAYLEMTAQWVVKLGLMVIPQKKAPTQ